MKNVKLLLQAALLTGTLDISAAVLQFYINTGKGSGPVLLYIASGLFGNQAFQGGSLMIIAGLALHYFIAGCFTFLFFLIAQALYRTIKSTSVIAILYGTFVWAIMRLVVLPASLVSVQPLQFKSALISCLILIICMGLPLAIIGNRFTKQANG